MYHSLFMRSKTFLNAAGLAIPKILHERLRTAWWVCLDLSCSFCVYLRKFGFLSFSFLLSLNLFLFFFSFLLFLVFFLFFFLSLFFFLHFFVHLVLSKKNSPTFSFFLSVSFPFLNWCSLCVLIFQEHLSEIWLSLSFYLFLSVFLFLPMSFSLFLSSFL